jgi:MoaA/NifB/PqqE/SkfB family radical SAM enzyme
VLLIAITQGELWLKRPQGRCFLLRHHRNPFSFFSLEINVMTPLAFASRRRKVDLIWNTTRVCPWDCEICCVDAIQPKKSGDKIAIHSAGLSDRFPRKAGSRNIFEQALAHLQERKIELDFAGKIRVLDHLDGYRVKIDISGGDPLCVAENLEVLKIAAERFGREQLTLTATGAGLLKYEPVQLADKIGELNFTYDNVTVGGNANRPGGYADGNLKVAQRFRRAGVPTRAECPLSVHNISEAVMQRLYLNLHEAAVDKLLLMRLFPVGRGVFRADDIPSDEQYRAAITYFRKLQAEFGRPVVKLQCALRYFDDSNLDLNPCDLGRESLGLMPDGTLLASPWAYDGKGGPLGSEWVLGNLAEQKLSDILATDKARYFLTHLDDNFGHCKIFAWRHSKRRDPLERIFDTTDPLYNKQVDPHEPGLAAPSPAVSLPILQNGPAVCSRPC